jgi:hypothetical protein
MTPQEHQSVAYAPELAVIHALRAVADATCAALAAAHPLVETEPPYSPEHEVAVRLYAAIGRLQKAVDAYCDFVAELRNNAPADSEDIPF